MADKFKEVIAAGITYDKLLPRAKKMHDMIMEFDEAALKDIARGRTAKGDVHAKRQKLRESLDKKSATYNEAETILNDEWNLVMAIYREVSEQMSDAHRQVARVLRLIGETSPEAKGPAEAMAKSFDEEHKKMIGKYA